ncbi:MAG: hypothetical protein ACI9XR_001412 [Flavobacterium sp.]|jgi:uncharacterized protein (TIGR02284 family)
MENLNSSTIDTLNGLISILEDGKLGYVNASEKTENPTLKEDFLQYSRERAQFVTEFQNEINKLGKSTDEGSGPLGAIHRAWIDIKSMVTSNDAEAIINACLTGEEAAVEKYKLALKQGQLNTDLRTIVAKQLAHIEGVIAIIKMQKAL